MCIRDSLEGVGPALLEGGHDVGGRADHRDVLDQRAAGVVDAGADDREAGLTMRAQPPYHLSNGALSPHHDHSVLATTGASQPVQHVAGDVAGNPVSYTHLTLPTNREV